jgi:carbonic anhydrase
MTLTTPMTANEVLELLLEGNRRYVGKQSSHPHQDPTRIHELATGQHPIAIILGCSDSRVPPEVIFDQGLGDLFVIRVAGNVVDDVVLGSIEYAVQELGVPLVLVLGHERCGAVTAAVKHLQSPGHVNALIKAIEPALVQVRSGSDPVDAGVTANVQFTVEEIKTSEPLLSKWVELGQIKVMGARYELDNGQVSLIP